MSKAKGHMFFSSVLKEVQKIPVSLILEKYIKVKANPHSDADGLCPFHGDTHFGNFKINNRKAIYKCFTCGVFGDGIQFLRDLNDLTFKQAVVKIAFDQGIISQEQASGFLEGKVSELSVNTVSDSLVIKDKLNGITEIASPFVRDIAYKMFLSNVSLSDEHRAYLKGRGLTDEEISSKGFFTFPEPTQAFIQDLKASCDKITLTPNVFKEVPGFHTMESMKLDTTQKNGEEEYMYTFSKKKGIGIPSKNTDGKIVGIQVRSDNPSNKKKKYTWFSSSYAAYEDNEYIFGTPAGAPTHISVPKENKFPGVVFVTEGFFKAEVLSKTFGAYAISVSGVGNYRDIIEDLKDIERVSKEKIAHVYIAYDADMSSNLSVYHHAKNMVALIKESFEVSAYVSLWNVEDGKGIDDLIQAGKGNTLKKVEFEVYERYYDKMIEMFVEKYEKLQKVPKEVVFETYKRYVLPQVVKVA